jgi:translation elongation factor EF-Tu-like GTPase
VLALGAQQAGQAVALLLRAATREHVVQGVVRAALGAPTLVKWRIITRTCAWTPCWNS